MSIPKPIDSNQTAITGRGCLTAAGLNPNDFYQSVLSGRSTVAKEPESGFATSLLSNQIIAQARPFVEQHQLYRRFDSNDFQSGWNRLMIPTLHSLFSALDESGLTDLPKNCGFIFATTTGTIPFWESKLVDRFQCRLSDQAFIDVFQHYPLSTAAKLIRKRLNHRGPCVTLVSACAAGTQALELARQWVISGKVSHCIVGATELLSDVTKRGFACFRLLGDEPAKPFDQNRRHINLAEASAFLVISSGNGMTRLVGGGMAQDAYDLTSPEPNGIGINRSMQAALQSANLQPKDITWVHAHGTGTPSNDAAEGSALATVFPNQPWVSSTKGAHGHSLAASGVLETILITEALQNHKVLPTHGLDKPDSALRLRHPKTAISERSRYVMKNTLGFGGVNASIILAPSEAN